MYFRLPNIFVANYIDTADSETEGDQPKYQLPAELLLEPQDFETKVIHAQAVIRWALEMCPGGVVMSTSFGMQSAIMLHLISQIDNSVPIIWIDTGYLPPETYHYAAQLKALFDLNVKIYQSEISPAHMEAIHGKLWEMSEPNAQRLYGLLRKVMPMRKAQKELNASLMLTGVRRSQTSHRKTMPIYTAAANENECGKVSPILSFTDDDTVEYFAKYDLPPHPLVAFGYTSVGDAHSSRPKLASDKDDRATRFGKSSQQECGLHTETGSLEEYANIITKAMRKSATDDEPDHVLPVHTLPTGYLVFGRVACKFCRAAKALLTSRNLPYTEFLVVKPGEATPDTDESTTITLGQLVQLVREVTEDADKKVTAVPQLFLDRGYIGGFTELCPTLEVSSEEAESLLENAVLELAAVVAPPPSSSHTSSADASPPPPAPAPVVPLAGCEAGLPKEMAEFFRGRI